MTAIQPCRERQSEFDRVLAELDRLEMGAPAPNDDLTGSRSPTMGGDLGSRFYETIGRREAALRRYRTAVRDLAECLRQQRQTSDFQP
ncbi:MAG: hypothetical protein WBR18_07395 [Anaerolineales bacterium]